MLYNIAICDDDQKTINTIRDYINKFSVQTENEFNIREFLSGDQLLNVYFNEKSPFDIVFLDMEMPGRNGIDTAKEIRNIPDREVLIAFITSYPEYMQDSFDVSVQASQYFTKPVDYDLFSGKLKKMLSYINDLDTNIIVVSNKSGEVVLHLEDIICIETDKSSNLNVTTIKGDISIKGSLSEFEYKLSDKYFICVHRTCLANMKYIRKFNAFTLEFSTGKTVPVSRRKMGEIKEAFAKYMVVRCRI